MEPLLKKNSLTILPLKNLCISFIQKNFTKENCDPILSFDFIIYDFKKCYICEKIIFKHILSYGIQRKIFYPSFEVCDKCNFYVYQTINRLF